MENQLGKDSPRNNTGLVITGTQTLEQSLDIDADLLITDLCPMDVLLQRIGRLHRHQKNTRPQEFQQATCIVIMPDCEDLTPFLSRKPDRNGLGGYVYEDVTILEATRQLTEQHSQSQRPWTIPRMSRKLVEQATHPDALRALADRKGDKWQTHVEEMKVFGHVENLNARQVIVQRDQPFTQSEAAFKEIGDNASTRLGYKGTTVEFNHPRPESPFSPSTKIDRLIIPHHMSRDLDPESTATAEPAKEGFTFTTGNARFRYHRHGLAPEQHKEEEDTTGC